MTRAVGLRLFLRVMALLRLVLGKIMWHRSGNQKAGCCKGSQNMRLGKISMAVMVALSMAGTPVLAQTSSPASKLSVSAAASKSVRTDATLQGESEARGSSMILAIGAIGLIILGVVVAAGGKSKPKSP